MRALRRTFFRWMMRLRFERAPEHPRSPDGRYIKRTDWRLGQMRAGR